MPPQCHVEGCENEASRLLGRNPRSKRRPDMTEGVGPLCGKHYTRLLRRGGVDVVLPHPSGADHMQWRGDDVSYFAVHERIKRRLGSARNHPCISCEGPAGHWAYDRTDANELRDSTGPYSTDLNRYQPMCVSCHKRMDIQYKPPKTHCPQNHEYTPDNIIYRRNGERRCRHCNKERCRQRYLARKNNGSST